LNEAEASSALIRAPPALQAAERERHALQAHVDALSSALAETERVADALLSEKEAAEEAAREAGRATAAAEARAGELAAELASVREELGRAAVPPTPPPAPSGRQAVAGEDEGRVGRQLGGAPEGLERLRRLYGFRTRASAPSGRAAAAPPKKERTADSVS
jgi:hypothetical protein